MEKVRMHCHEKLICIFNLAEGHYYVKNGCLAVSEQRKVPCESQFCHFPRIEHVQTLPISYQHINLDHSTFFSHLNK